MNLSACGETGWRAGRAKRGGTAGLLHDPPVGGATLSFMHPHHRFNVRNLAPPHQTTHSGAVFDWLQDLRLKDEVVPREASARAWAIPVQTSSGTGSPPHLSQSGTLAGGRLPESICSLPHSVRGIHPRPATEFPVASSDCCYICCTDWLAWFYGSTLHSVMQGCPMSINLFL